MSPFRPLLLTLAVLAACGAPAPQQNAVEGPRGQADSPVAQEQAAALALLAERRSSAGLSPLVPQSQLQQAAQAQADVQARGGSGDILTQARSRGYAGCVLGEARARGLGDARGAVARLLAGDQASALILSPDVGQVGLGVARDPAGVLHWALALATEC